MAEPVIDLPAAALVAAAARAEHIGPLARPTRLRAGVCAHAEGRLSAGSLGALEDLAIFDSLWEQDTVGLDVFSDGQFRRPIRTDGLPSPGAVASEAEFLREHAPGLFKVALPSPSTQALRTLFSDEAHLSSPDRILTARACSVAAELCGAVAAGARYVELDADGYCRFLDPFVRTSWRAWGIDPTRLAGLAVEADAACVTRLRAAGAAVGVRFCRTFLHGARLGAAQRTLAASLLEVLPYDRLLADLDPNRPVPVEVLRAVPPGRSIVLGLVSTGAAEKLPSYNRLARYVAAVAGIVPAAALAVGTTSPPSCAGRVLTARLAEQRALHLITRVAHSVDLGEVVALPVGSPTTSPRSTPGEGGGAGVRTAPTAGTPRPRWAGPDR